MKFLGANFSGSIEISGSLHIPYGNKNQRPSNPESGSLFLEISDSGSNVIIYNGQSGSGWEYAGVQGNALRRTFPTPYPVDVEYIVVAGGGGGGPIWGGGGGAGGAKTGSITGVESGDTFIADIGAGGASYTNGNTSSLAGSTITTIDCVGGGRGGRRTGGSTTGADGGSGGGGCYSGGTGGAGTSGQGYGGAAGPVWPQYGGGGGGGATQQPARPAGNSAVSDPPEGSGGRGHYWPAGSTNGYAGGGGAAHQGNATTWSRDWGGGGLGSDSTMLNGIANTGGGGGGYHSDPGGSGGSGVIILRYQWDSPSATGGVITSSSGYIYHTITSSIDITFT